MGNNFNSAVNAFYLAYYGRPADPAGLAFWSTQLENSGGDFGSIIDFFSTSAEASSRFGDDTVAQRITTVYQQLFGRAPDAAGLQFWVDAIEAGHTTVAAVAMEVLQGAQHQDIVVSTLRQQAAADFTALVAQDGSIDFTGNAAIEASRALVAAVNAQTTQASLAAMVKVAGGLVDIAHDTPAVVAALGGDVAALFSTARGRAEPENLLRALADVAKAAAGDPATLESLLRGGGMAKVLDVMPASATLQDVVDALASGGLPAAVEVVYPSAAEPVLAVGFGAGKLTLAGDAAYDVLVDLDAHTVSYNGNKVAIAGDVASVVAKDYPGKVTVQGTVVELAAVLPLSLGQDAHRVVDAKAALFAGDVEARTLVPGALDLLKGAELVTVKDTLSAEENDLLRNLDGFEMAHLRAVADLVAPAAGTLRFVDLDTGGAGGPVPVTRDDTFALAVDGAEEGAQVRYQVRAAGQDGWIDLPSASLAGVAEGSYGYRAVVTDAAGNVSRTDAVELVIDKTAPAVGDIVFGANDGALALAESVELTVSFAETVLVDGTPALALNNGGSATYVRGSGSDKLVFKYTPAAGQDIGALKLAAHDPFGGAVVDRAGNALAATAFDGHRVQGDVAVDTVAPTQQITFTTITQTGGSSDSVSGSEDPLPTNLPVATVRAKMSAALASGEHVEVSFDGGQTWSAQNAATDGRAVIVTNVTTTGNPTISLRVVDAAGNAGTPVSHAIAYDDVAPDGGTLVFKSVTEGQLDGHADNVTNQAQATLAFRHEGNWIGAGERMEYSVDGATWIGVDDVAGDTLRVAIEPGLGVLGQDGNRTTTVQVRAVDAAGNTSLLGSADVVYDNGAAAPTLALDNDTAGKYGSGSDRITSVGTFHAVGVETGGHAEYSLTGTGGWSATAPLAGEGPNTVHVRQVDAAGNVSESTSLSFTLDTGVPAAPSVALALDTGTSASDKITKSGLVDIGGLETAAGSAWEYRIDGGAWTQGGQVDNQGHAGLTVAGDAAHTVLVRQYDAAGNVSQQGSLGFTLDTSAPTLAFANVQGATSVTPNVTTRSTANVVFSYTGTLGSTDTIEYRVDGGAWTTATNATINRTAHTITLPNFDLSAADPQIDIRVGDVAGNMSAEAGVHIDGPYVAPQFTTKITEEGLEVTSLIDGTLYLQRSFGNPTLLTETNGSSTIAAGQTVVIGEQAEGTVAGRFMIKTSAGTEFVETGSNFYMFGYVGGGTMTAGGSAINIWGFGGNDTLNGSPYAESLFGGAGNDTINGGGGDDVLSGGAGNNKITGGAGADRIDVTLGQNQLVYDAGDSTASGFDVVTFAPASGTNLAPQVFHFNDTMATTGATVGNVAAPLDASPQALLDALDLAYQGKFAGTTSAALVVKFANQDTYLVVDTGDGHVNAADHVVKLVGYVPSVYVIMGDVSFGSPP